MDEVTKVEAAQAFIGAVEEWVEDITYLPPSGTTALVAWWNDFVTYVNMDSE